ncbi:hypothetical protein [Streptomyces sp. NPDC050388]|uniref:hypothetical protein n=1 Tax=Streptomyces sp. NPDC050388 TaxID=3155781 RepID=UPI00342F3D13
MTDEAQFQAKRPVSASLAGPYGHPFHPILVTVPIGALLAATVGFLGLFTIPGRTPAFRTALVLVLLTALGIGGT